MSRKQAECLLAAVIFARSTSLLFAKIGLNSFTPLNLLAAVYFTNFLLNACQAVPLHSPLFSVGLWLFLLCDVCVGIRNQPELFPGWLAAFAQVGMWLFYLPGQVLLVLSGRKGEAIIHA